MARPSSSNPKPPRCKRGALARLSYEPINISGKAGVNEYSLNEQKRKDDYEKIKEVIRHRPLVKSGQREVSRFALKLPHETLLLFSVVKNKGGDPTAGSPTVTL